jgi:hypothetical protein
MVSARIFLAFSALTELSRDCYACIIREKEHGSDYKTGPIKVYDTGSKPCKTHSRERSATMLLFARSTYKDIPLYNAFCISLCRTLFADNVPRKSFSLDGYGVDVGNIGRYKVITLPVNTQVQ